MPAPIVASSSQSRSAGPIVGPTKSGWDAIPVNVFDREMKGWTAGDDSMATNVFTGVVAQKFLNHAPLYVPKGMTRPSLEEFSPGIVANRYELVFIMRGYAASKDENDRFKSRRLVQYRGARPSSYPMFTPGVTLRQLNRHLRHVSEQGGWSLDDMNKLFGAINFFGAVDSVGPGESMKNDRNHKNYVIVVKHRVITWNIWPNAEIAGLHLFLDVFYKHTDNDPDKYIVTVKPTTFDSIEQHQKFIAEQNQAQMDNGDAGIYHFYYVGRSGGHEQGGMGLTVAPAVQNYLFGDEFSMEHLPKTSLYILDH